VPSRNLSDLGKGQYEGCMTMVPFFRWRYDV